MATTTEIAPGTKSVGALFESNHDANKAVDALLKEGILPEDIYVQVEVNDKEAKKAQKHAMKAVGFEDPDQRYFEKALKEGKTLVTVTNLAPEQTGEVITILNQNGSHYNPDGSRNIRDDVVGMTTGVLAGTAVGVLAGPVGAGIGAIAGAAIGTAVGGYLERHE